MTELSNIRERVERSLYHSIRSVVCANGYLPDIFSTTNFAITYVDKGTKTFKVGSDVTGLLGIGGKFIVMNSSGNDTGFNPFTITIAPSFTAGETTLVVEEDITDSTVDGDIGILNYQDTSAGLASYESDLSDIVDDKGFAIEVFGVGSSQSKKEKAIPRIVIVANRVLPGSLGGGPVQVYGDDPLNAGKLKKDFLQPQTSDLQYDIHIISNTARQDRLMHSIVALALPKRGYVRFYDEFSVNFFVRQYSYRDIPNTRKGIDERVYLYEVLDIFETEQITIQDNISKIQQIKVEERLGDEDDSSEISGSPFIVS